MAHVAPWKEAQVQDLMQIITDKPVVGVVNIHGIPGPQIQKMRQNLQDKAIVRIAKIKLLLLALEEMETKKEGIIELVQSLDGQMGLIATDMNPFKLFQVLEKSKAPAPVKGGEVIPDDIEIKAGETAFKPGPIVGELQRVGIPAAIEQGKVVIKSDKVLIKAGETVTKEVATMLTRLEIYPLTVGLDLQAVFENGVIFKKSDLDIDPKQFIDNLALGCNHAFNLAIYCNYINPVTLLPILQNAHAKAINLMYNANIVSPTTIGSILSKSVTNMLNLASRLQTEALDDELKDRIGAAAKATKAPKTTEPEEPDKDAKEKKKKGKDKEKKKEDEKEVSEEEAAAGLGQLFG